VRADRCETIDDTTESPDPDPLPQCGNDADDDGDSLIDFPDDLGCARASDDLELDCEDSDPVVPLSDPVVTGTTSGATNDFVPSCSSGSTAPDLVFSLQTPGNLTSLHVDTNGSVFDTVIYVKADGCDGADIGCDDDGGDGLQSLLDFTSLSAGTYFIFVDGFGGGEGSYTLNVSGVIANNQPCVPALETSGLLTCGTGRTCTDAGAMGFRCM
jgi:hypothetical protein